MLEHNFHTVRAYSFGMEQRIFIRLETVNRNYVRVIMSMSNHLAAYVSGRIRISPGITWKMSYMQNFISFSGNLSFLALAVR